MPRLSCESSSGWPKSRHTDGEVKTSWHTAPPPDFASALPWGAPVATDAGAVVPWAPPIPSDPDLKSPWGAGRRGAIEDAASAWTVSRPSDAAHRIDAPSPALLALSDVVVIPWGGSAPADTVRRVSGALSPALRSDNPFGSCWGNTVPADALDWLPWGMGRIVDVGVVIIIEAPDPDLPDGAIIIPIRRAYIVINSASLRRVSNNLSLPASAITVSIDSQSVHWSWSATMPLAALPNLERDAPGQPVELEAEINGVHWRLAVERQEEDEGFGSAVLRVGGRGVSAELSDPVYPVVQHDNVATPMTARQLADQALTFNGVSLGWTLDWQAADWLIPAGAWLFSGTPLAAVARIAEAAGAYVQPARNTRTLHVLPRYPAKPWEWASTAPDVVIPASATLQRGASHSDKPDYNLVIVRGLAGGIGVRVRRAGSAGDRPAPMIVDPLITHIDAATGRGLAVLGDTGPKIIARYETGVLPAVGVIPVGTLLDWTRGAQSQKGLVRALSVSAAANGRDPIRVRQTLEVEFNG